MVTSGAFAAATEDPRVGAMLPCNVVIYERDDGAVMIGAVDPMQSLGAGGAPALRQLADTVKEKLSRALAAVE
jgi:uncharacterized protein (DUF302 family)